MRVFIFLVLASMVVFSCQSNTTEELSNPSPEEIKEYFTRFKKLIIVSPTATEKATEFMEKYNLMHKGWCAAAKHPKADHTASYYKYISETCDYFEYRDFLKDKYGLSRSEFSEKIGSKLKDHYTVERSDLEYYKSLRNE